MGVTVSLHLSHMVELGVRQLQGRSTKHRISDTHHFAGQAGSAKLSISFLFFKGESLHQDRWNSEYSSEVG